MLVKAEEAPVTNGALSPLAEEEVKVRVTVRVRCSLAEGVGTSHCEPVCGGVCCGMVDATSVEMDATSL